jgi:hypothetical protein
LWPVGLGRYRRDRLVAPPHELIESLGGLDVATDVRLLVPGESTGGSTGTPTR